MPNFIRRRLIKARRWLEKTGQRITGIVRPTRVGSSSSVVSASEIAARQKQRRQDKKSKDKASTKKKEKDQTSPGSPAVRCFSGFRRRSNKIVPLPAAGSNFALLKDRASDGSIKLQWEKTPTGGLRAPQGVVVDKKKKSSPKRRSSVSSLELSYLEVLSVRASCSHEDIEVLSLRTLSSHEYNVDLEEDPMNRFGRMSPGIVTPPHPPSARNSVYASTRRVRSSSPVTVRRPLPPGPGPLDDKGERLVLKPIDKSSSFRPRKPCDKTPTKPLRAIHSLDRVIVSRPASDLAGNATGGKTPTLVRRSKSFEDSPSKNSPSMFISTTPDLPRQVLAPLTQYKASNFGTLPDALARGGSPHSLKRSSTLGSPESTYVVSDF